jgi:glycosyltransferase involved in cell wall biosynthesis
MWRRKVTMRVVQVGKFYPPQYQGGLESVVVGINDELVTRGVGVTAVVAAVGQGGTDDYHGVRVVRVPSVATILSQPLTPGYGRAVRAAPGDLLHLHHPNPLGDLAAMSDGRPLVITQHSDIVRQRLLRPFYLPLVRRTFARARRIAVGSEQLLGTSAELKGFEAKARVIPFGIDASRFALTDAVRQRVAGLRASWGDAPVILAVGRLVGYKGFDVLLRAAAGLEARVVIVGTGPEEAGLRRLVTTTPYPVPHTPVFAGRVSDSDLVAYYHACDVFCLPSVTIAEAFGMVLLEAMACGKPLVTTSLPTGVSAVNRDGKTGLVVPPGDAGALREALKALIEDEQLRKSMGETGRAVQAAEYTASLMGERYVKLYEEALGNGS